MRLPQSISRRFSTHVFSVITITVFALVLPLCARAVTQQLTCMPSKLRFGTVPVGQSETQVVVLTNSGQTSVTVSAMNLSATEFTTSQLGLPLILTAGQSATVNVIFSPTAAGWTGGNVTFVSNAANPGLLLQLAGTGVTSDTVTASPSAASFGQVAVGASSKLSVVLTNDRSWKVKVSGFPITGNEFSVSGPAVPMYLRPGQSISIQLTFAPQSAGATAGNVYVSGPGVVIPLTGTGTTSAAGQLTIAPAPLNFGDVPVGTTDTQSISMSATGNSVTVSGDSSSNSQFVLNGASLPFTIPAGQSVSFNVAFTPKASGTVSGSLSFSSNASNPNTLESLSGIGTVTQHSVNLYWNADTGVIGYNVYRSPNANGTYSKINSAVDPNTAYTDSTVVSGQTYYYEATAVNSSGQESARSTPPVQATIP